jgi:hypothetical protein
MIDICKKNFHRKFVQISDMNQLFSADPDPDRWGEGGVELCTTDNSTQQPIFLSSSLSFFPLCIRRGFDKKFAHAVQNTNTFFFQKINTDIKKRRILC